MVDISTGCWKHFDFPTTVASVSTLSNGTVVVNAAGSGIQMLRLGQEPSSPQQPTPLLTAYPLDKGRIIATVPTTDDRIIFLGTATMSQVFSILTQKGLSVAAGHTVVLCASLENKIAVCCLKGWTNSGLGMWEFSHGYPQWTYSEPILPSVGNLSPAGTRLVTYGRDSDRRGCVGIWDMHCGKPSAWTETDDPPPIDIIFDSEVRFYLYGNTHREPYVINTVSQTDDPTIDSITRYTKQQLDGQVLEERYFLDDGREWVICGSKRICWVPPGYIGSSHCWAGSSLVMVGQDGTLRKLTFLESLL